MCRSKLYSRIFLTILPVSLLFLVLLTSCPDTGQDGSDGTITLGAPSDLSAEATSPGSIELTWTSSNDSVEGYEIERSLSDSSGFEQIATAEETEGADEYEYLDLDLDPDTTYYYRVRAYSGSDYSDYTQTADASTDPAKFPDSEIPLAEGDFWDFRWMKGVKYLEYYDELKWGAFKVTLGAETEIDGITGYTIEYDGSFADFMDMPWQYMATDGFRLLCSSDGATWQTIFDGTLGYWAAGGFFRVKPADMISSASSGTISGIDYIEGEGIVIGGSDSSTDCTTVAGYGTVCGGGGYEGWSKYEYFRDGIGPVGYRFYYSEFSWDWSSSTEHEIGLVASSLAGDEDFIVAEIEPNEYPDTTQQVASRQIIVGDVHQDDTTSTFDCPDSDTFTTSRRLDLPAKGATIPGTTLPTQYDIYTFHDSTQFVPEPGSESFEAQLCFLTDDESTEVYLYVFALTDTDLVDLIGMDESDAWNRLTVEFTPTDGVTYVAAVHGVTTPERISYMLKLEPQE